MDLVHGAQCRVLERHPRACQHCGFAGFSADARCGTCGVQVHSACLTLADGTCDECRHDVHTSVCQLCLCDDPPTTGVAGETDRLTKTVVYHGRWWKRADRPPDGYRRVVERLNKQVSAVFRPEELPFDGKHPMAVCVEGTWYVSIPLVVHTWCAQCLFQVSPVDDEAWTTTIVDRMESPVRLSCATFDIAQQLGRATFETHPCVFCDAQEGWTTFCLYHLTKQAGCVRCGDRHEQTTCHRAFHPSCAVRAGMQRILRWKEGFGMLCYHNKNFRGQHFPPPLRKNLDWCSGINERLCSPPFAGCVLHDVPSDAPNKGRKHREAVGEKRPREP